MRQSVLYNQNKDFDICFLSVSLEYLDFFIFILKKPDVSFVIMFMLVFLR